MRKLELSLQGTENVIQAVPPTVHTRLHVPELDVDDAESYGKEVVSGTQLYKHGAISDVYASHGAVFPCFN